MEGYRKLTFDEALKLTDFKENRPKPVIVYVYTAMHIPPSDLTKMYIIYRDDQYIWMKGNLADTGRAGQNRYGWTQNFVLADNAAGTQGSGFYVPTLERGQKILRVEANNRKSRLGHVPVNVINTISDFTTKDNVIFKSEDSLRGAEAYNSDAIPFFPTKPDPGATYNPLFVGGGAEKKTIRRSNKKTRVSSVKKRTKRTKRTKRRTKTRTRRR